MTWQDWVDVIFGGGGLLGLGVLIFRSGSLAEKIKQIYENHLPHIYDELREIRNDIKEHSRDCSEHDRWERDRAKELESKVE